MFRGVPCLGPTTSFLQAGIRDMTGHMYQIGQKLGNHFCSLQNCCFQKHVSMIYSNYIPVYLIVVRVQGQWPDACPPAFRGPCGPTKCVYVWVKLSIFANSEPSQFNKGKLISHLETQEEHRTIPISLQVGLKIGHPKNQWFMISSPPKLQLRWIVLFYLYPILSLLLLVE